MTEKSEIDNIILAQLRVIRAENEKRDRDFALLRGEFTMFRGLVDLKLDSILSMLSTHTDTLYQINERLLALQRALEPGSQPEGEP